MFFPESLAFFLRDLSFLTLITFVCHQDSLYILASMLFDLLHPILDIVEGASVSNIVDQHDAVRTLVVSRSDRPESILTCGIPYLHSGFLAIDAGIFNFEVNANCIIESSCEGVLHITHEHTGLAHPRVAN